MSCAFLCTSSIKASFCFSITLEKPSINDSRSLALIDSQENHQVTDSVPCTSTISSTPRDGIVNNHQVKETLAHHWEGTAGRRNDHIFVLKEVSHCKRQADTLLSTKINDMRNNKYKYRYFDGMVLRVILTGQECWEESWRGLAFKLKDLRGVCITLCWKSILFDNAKKPFNCILL